MSAAEPNDLSLGTYMIGGKQNQKKQNQTPHSGTWTPPLPNAHKIHTYNVIKNWENTLESHHKDQQY